MPASRAASAREKPSSALASAKRRMAARRSGSRRARRRSSSADTSWRMASAGMAAVLPSPIPPSLRPARNPPVGTSMRGYEKGIALAEGGLGDARRLLGHGLDHGGFERHGLPPAGGPAAGYPPTQAQPTSP